MSKPLGYTAISIRVVALVVLSIVTTATIIPTAVSSPGIPHSFADPTVELPVTSAVESEDDFLEPLDVVAPLPFLRRGAAESFNALRSAVIDAAGFDFLARCGDMLRVGNAKVLKLGTAFNSRHKKGEAFDYNQEDPRLLLVRERDSKGVRWRTYLLCEKQDATTRWGANKCAKADLHTDNAGLVSGYVFDFTAAAEKFGWERIYAHAGWTKEPTKKEFWHYQLQVQADQR